MERTDLIAAIREAMADHPCRFDIDEAAVSQIVVMLETVGEGNLQRGVQRVLKNHEWLVERRKKDPEYTRNHETVSSLLNSTDVVTEQIRRGVIWLFILAIAAFLVFGTKLGLIKSGG
jgi:hypothetical protein